MFICVVDLRTGVMTYANGGQNRPLLARGGEYRFMELKTGVPPGMFADCEYTNCSLTLESGDRLYLYTDGVNEAMNSRGEEFGNDRFLATANRFRDLEPEALDGKIREAIREWAGSAEQSDDITTLAFHFKGAFGFGNESLEEL
jgi:sigma-B regulation protein RsbU (phosphoserine phosphatase)